MSGAVKYVVGMALMFTGIFTGNLMLAKAGFYLASMGVLEEASKLFTPKPPKQRIRQDVEYSGTVTPRRIIYGKLRVGALNTIRPLVVDPKGKLLHQVLTIAGHPCNAITRVWFNQDEVGTRTAVTGTENDGLVTSGTYDDLAWVRCYTGSQTSVDYILNAADSAFWTSSHVGYGLTYAALTFKLDDKVYASGKPEVAFEVEGKKCYDPRLDTSPGANPTNASYITYTTNPALQIADYLMDTALGCSVPAARIDWALVVAAANECDELVSIPGSTTQKRYESSVVLEAAVDRREDNIAALAGAMMGVAYRQGGVWRMYAGAALTPSFALTEADVVGTVTCRLETPTGERYNFVRGTFTDAARNYQEVEFEPRGSAAYESADGRRIPKTVSFDTCTNAYQAQRNAIILRRRSRMRRTLTARFALSAYKIRPFIVGTMTFADIGWSAQRVVCTSWKFVGDGSIEMTLQEDASTIWDDPNPASDYTTPGAGTSGTLTSYTPDPPSSLAANPVRGAIEFSWTMPLEVLAGDVIELWEHTSSTPFASATKIWEGAASRVTIEKSDTTTRYYWVRARALNTNVSSTAPESTGLAAAALAGPVDGAPGITVTLSRPAVSVPARADGTNPTLTNTGTEIRVYEGTTLLAFESATPDTTSGNSAWRLTSAPSGNSTITPGAVTDSGSYATVAAATAFTADTGRVTFTINGKRANGTVFSALVAEQVFAKVRNAEVQELTVSASAGTYQASSSGAAESGSVSATIIPTITVSGGTAPYTYAWTETFDTTGGVNCSNTAIDEPTFGHSGAVSQFSAAYALWRLTVTDSNGLKGWVDVGFRFRWVNTS